jgi:NAD(P)-dependent dehydrogenase (short-subunit alcohol dehydrogenase family)
MSRTYVVTGSASGIGQATAARLQRDGATVIGVDLRDADVRADLSTPAGRAAMVADVHDRVDRLDGVVSCAGVDMRDPLTVKVNYFGAVATLEGLRDLLARGTKPRAAVIASFAAIHGPFDEEMIEACLAGDEPTAVAAAERHGPDDTTKTVYTSSKKAIARWVRQAAPSEPWAGAGIPLNAIAPGIIVTPMTQPLLEDERLARGLGKRVPMPLHGPGTPDDVAALLAWLVGEENVLVTGQVIFIDGGADTVLRGDLAW